MSGQNEIDWRKAPANAAGALIAKERNIHHPQTVFFSHAAKTGCMFRGFAADDGRPLSAPDDCWDLVYRPAQAWNGEGLPPVGTVCQWREKVGFQWVAAMVLFITEKSVVLQRSDGFEWQMVTSRAVFRPIRTAEQIAAEEREKAILQMMADGELHIAGAKFNLSSGHAEALYDAGYRKQESEK